MHTRAELESSLQIALAGMVAEELECGDMSSGASGDLHQATAVACQMIGALGMGASLLSLEAAQGPLSGNIVDKVLADASSRAAANQLLDAARDHVHALLAARRVPLRRAAQALLDRDEITGIELTHILAGQPVTG